MATIIPLKGLRYDEDKAGDIKDLVTPPYDVIDAAAQEAYYRRSPYNIIRLEYGKKFPADNDTDNRYTRAADFFRRWQAEGVLRQEDEPALYLYQQQFNVGDQTLVRSGFICCVKLEPYENGVVLPHEETMPKHKADRLALMQACRANFSPIFGLFSDPARKIDDLLLRAFRDLPPAIDFTDEQGNGHRLWVIKDTAVQREVQRLMEAQRILIADGHHRYETALKYARENPDKPAAAYVMMTLVNLYDPGLVILPTHRLVLNGALDGLELLAALREDFIVEKLPYSEVSRVTEVMFNLAGIKGKGNTAHRQVFGLYTGKGEFFSLLLKDESLLDSKMPAGRSKAWRSLDVSVLQNLILENILGINREALAGGEAVKYTRDEKEAVLAVDEGRCNMAFLMNPTLIAEVTEVAAKGEKMPQKSTFFYPKLITGLVINKF
ncbi:DUF1015 domain-containing protein [Desulfoscipio geothermicus]|uniref:Uncharacterized conserved protein, DUF1015 family n=1 Tax=Desulfoscipio geothermicus DSM 3669 TaxID=1121426 RepID=A0A1I6CVA7_9FIRM|nr:DUF1015 domain-containing protein [Desulfoscipio geothermicus]SFQ97175.1 Uncharacterized conserved protein, DUF1015 family [Desulfoscipio geothermicus DSM 3669]